MDGAAEASLLVVNILWTASSISFPASCAGEDPVSGRVAPSWEGGPYEGSDWARALSKAAIPTQIRARTAHIICRSPRGHVGPTDIQYTTRRVMHVRSTSERAFSSWQACWTFTQFSSPKPARQSIAGRECRGGRKDGDGRRAACARDKPTKHTCTAHEKSGSFSLSIINYPTGRTRKGAKQIPQARSITCPRGTPAPYVDAVGMRSKDFFWDIFFSGHPRLAGVFGDCYRPRTELPRWPGQADRYVYNSRLAIRTVSGGKAAACLEAWRGEQPYSLAVRGHLRYVQICPKWVYE